MFIRFEKDVISSLVQKPNAYTKLSITSVPSSEQLTQKNSNELIKSYNSFYNSEIHGDFRCALDVASNQAKDVQDMQSWQGVGECLKELTNFHVVISDLTNNAIERAREKVFKVLLIAAKDPSLKKALTTILKLHIEEQAGKKEGYEISLGEGRPQYTFKTDSQFDKLPEPEQNLILASHMLREFQGLTGGLDCFVTRKKQHTEFSSIREQLENKLWLKKVSTNLGLAYAFSDYDPMAGLVIASLHSEDGNKGNYFSEVNNFGKENDWSLAAIEDYVRNLASLGIDGFDLHEEDPFVTFYGGETNPMDHPRTKCEERPTDKSLPQKIVLLGLERRENAGESGDGSEVADQAKVAKTATLADFQQQLETIETGREKEMLQQLKALFQIKSNDSTFNSFRTALLGAISKREYSRALELAERASKALTNPTLKSSFKSVVKVLSELHEWATVLVDDPSQAPSVEPARRFNGTPQALTGIPEVNPETYVKFWGNFPGEFLNKLLGALNEPDSSLKAIYTENNYLRNLLKGCASGRTTAEALEVFLGSPDNLTEVHENNRQNLSQAIKEVLNERERRSIAEIESKATNSSEEVREATIKTDKVKKKRKNEPRVEQARTVGISLPEQSEQPANLEKHKEFAKRRPIIQTAIDPVAANVTFGDYIKTRQELKVLDATEEGFEFPPQLEVGSTTDLNPTTFSPAQAHAQRYMQNAQQLASEIGVSAQELFPKKLLPVEKLNRLSSWSIAIAKSEDSYSPEEQKTFLALIQDSLLNLTPTTMAIDDIGFRAAITNNSVVCNPQEYSELQAEFSNLSLPDLLQKASEGMTNAKFKALSAVLNQLLKHTVQLDEFKQTVMELSQIDPNQKTFAEVQARMDKNLQATTRKWIPKAVSQVIFSKVPLSDLIEKIQEYEKSANRLDNKHPLLLLALGKADGYRLINLKSLLVPGFNADSIRSFYPLTYGHLKSLITKSQANFEIIGNQSTVNKYNKQQKDTSSNPWQDSIIEPGSISNDFGLVKRFVSMYPGSPAFRTSDVIKAVGDSELMKAIGALMLNPTMLRDLQAINMHLKQGNYKAAATLAEQCFKRSPDNLQFLSLYLQAEYMTGNSDKVLRCIEENYELYDNDAKKEIILRMKGFAQLDLFKVQDAYNSFEESYKLNPNHDATVIHLVLLGNMLSAFDRDSYKSAKELFEHKCSLLGELLKRDREQGRDTTTPVSEILRNAAHDRNANIEVFKLTLFQSIDAINQLGTNRKSKEGFTLVLSDSPEDECFVYDLLT